ncbi:MAG: HEPN domain-containing protein [Bacteroidetes bacterium]|nr:HEPN domain-containing protein [Fibrella sp.]
MNELTGPYMERAESALESADILYQNEQFLALANRAYYAVFYCVSALLSTQGVHTKKHQAARAKFGELFVNTGLFTVDASKIVGHAFNARQSADYDTETQISDEQAQILLADSQTFYDLTVAYLNKSQP